MSMQTPSLIRHAGFPASPRILAISVVLALLGLLSAACEVDDGGGAGSEARGDEADTGPACGACGDAGTADGAAADTGGTTHADTSSGTADTDFSDAIAPDAGADAGEEWVGDASAGADTGGTAGPDDGVDPGDDGGSGEEPIEVPPGQLTAGEWSDLDHWDFWLGLVVPDGEGEDWSVHLDYWQFDPTVRIPVDVVAGEVPLVDASVTLEDADGSELWTTHTDLDGRAELFAAMFGPEDGPFTVRVEVGEHIVFVDDVTPDWEQPVQIDLLDSVDAVAPDDVSPDRSLDLMFVMDTTGSMADELGYLQAELEDVIERVEAELAGDLSLQVSVNFYRDDGDTYVVRSFPFTEDVDQAVSDLREQSASGGGDWPEAVERALADAVDEHQWRQRATARLLFLVLDAPPHHESQVIGTLQSVAEAAAAQGIRVVPVTGTGISKDTEFLMRSLAIATGGTYVFLTDHSGVGGEHLDPTDGPEPTIPKVQIELLNDLLVRLVLESI